MDAEREPRSLWEEHTPLAVRRRLADRPAPSYLQDFIYGAVDGADRQSWRLNFGLTLGALNAQGDADYDGDVDGDDFLAWQQRLGSTAATPNSMHIPEPSGVALACVTLVALGSSANRRHGRSSSKQIS